MPITKKAIGTRMGKGVGNFFKNISNIRQGVIILEILTNFMLSESYIKKSLTEASKKLSVSTKVYKKII
jgi:ribosomal protein L16/L10AE